MRRVLLGGSLVLAPLLIAISDLIAPTVNWESNADIVATATSQSALWQTNHLIAIFGFMLLIPAIIAAAELVRARFARMALAIVVMVSLSSMLVIGAIFSETTLAGAGGVSSGAMDRYMTQANELTGMGVLFPLFFTAYIGYVLLAFTLWRSKATPIWVPVLLLVSFTALFFSEQNLVSGIAGLGFAAASGGMAWAFMTGDEEPAPAVVPKAIAEAA